MTNRPSNGKIALAMLAAVATLLGRELGLAGLALVGKPWPVLILAVWVASVRRDRMGRLASLGFGSSAVADVLLDLPGAFLPGVAVFALAHLFYIAAFVSEPAGRHLAPLRQLPYVVWVLALLVYVVPRVGALGVPFAVYGLIILTMMGRAVSRVGSPPRPGEVWAALGASVFGLSDSLIALSRAGVEIPGKSWVIISLYWIGQSLLAAGIVRGGRALNDEARP